MKKEAVFSRPNFLSLSLIFSCNLVRRMVRLLAIMGSPRKEGNTEILITEALKAGELEEAEKNCCRFSTRITTSRCCRERRGRSKNREG
jgi:hypothetical protein